MALLNCVKISYDIHVESVTNIFRWFLIPNLFLDVEAFVPMSSGSFEKKPQKIFASRLGMAFKTSIWNQGLVLDFNLKFSVVEKEPTADENLMAKFL